VEDWSDLPGSELIDRGLSDAAAGRETAAALLVTIGAPRLRRAGLSVPAGLERGEAAELRLYRCLRAAVPREAFGRYNALLRELVSFERALEHRRESERRKERVRGGR
jgi:hypothetical protein